MAHISSANAARQPISKRGLEYGRFKATPTQGGGLPIDRPRPPHKMIRDFDLKRFERGLHIDERGAGSDPNKDKEATHDPNSLPFLASAITANSAMAAMDPSPILP